MRKLIVCNIMSLDGYYEAPEKDIMPMFDYRFDGYEQDDSFDRYNAERLRAADTLLLGRASYQGFRGYWPPVADDPDAPPIAREVSRLNNAIDKVVVSDGMAPVKSGPWQNTRIIRRAEAHEQIAELKRQPGRDILVFGSRVLWNDLLANGLVDELHLLISPVLLGAGTPLFDGRPPVSLQLRDSHTWAGSALALTRYDVRPK